MFKSSTSLVPHDPFVLPEKEHCTHLLVILQPLISSSICIFAKLCASEAGLAFIVFASKEHPIIFMFIQHLAGHLVERSSTANYYSHL